MGLEAVALRPRVVHMNYVFLPTRLRLSLQVAASEGVVEQLPLIQPRGMSRGEPGSPLPPAGGEVVLLRPGDVAGPAVMDQEHAPEFEMSPPAAFLCRDAVLGVVGLQADRLHLAHMDDQEHQDANRAVPDGLKLLLLDRAGDGPADRAAFEHLALGHLLRAHDPNSLLDQPFGVGVAPEHHLRPILEPGVQPGYLPAAGAVRLEIDLIQDPADRAGADGRDDPIEEGLAGQVFTGPVSDVQALGDWLQASPCDDMSPLEGGKSGQSGRICPCDDRSRARPIRTPRNVDSSARRWSRRTTCGKRRSASARLLRW
jgi:hypothetical protein